MSLLYSEIPRVVDDDFGPHGPVFFEILLQHQQFPQLDNLSLNSEVKG